MRKILLQIFIFSVLFIATFTINRILMQNSFIPAGLISDKNEIFLMYLLGVFHDIRFLSAAFLPFLLCGFLSLIFSNIKINNKLVIYSKNFYFIFSSVYIIVLSCLCIGFSYAKYYYYEIYKTKFDIFMFTLKDDNTKTILSIIYHDYPILKIFSFNVDFWSFCSFFKFENIKFKAKTC